MANSDYKRWYDNDPRMAKMMVVLSHQSVKQQNEFARVLGRLLKRQNEDSSRIVSLGAEKVLNLYKAYNKRRWYDENPALAHELNLLSVLPEDEFMKIVYDLSISFKYMLD